MERVRRIALDLERRHWSPDDDLCIGLNSDNKRRGLAAAAAVAVAEIQIRRRRPKIGVVVVISMQLSIFNRFHLVPTMSVVNQLGGIVAH